VGDKLANRIVLELKDKVKKFNKLSIWLSHFTSFSYWLFSSSICWFDSDFDFSKFSK
jgi:hypothetical protein